MRPGYGTPLDAPHADVGVDPDDAQAAIQAASVGGWQAVGPRSGRPVRKVQVLGGREVSLPPRCAGYEGYTLHAGVGVKASDRSGLERPRDPAAKAKTRGHTIHARGRRVEVCAL